MWQFMYLETYYMRVKMTKEKIPIYFTCDVPGLLNTLERDGYAILLLPLVGHLKRIAERAIEIEDPVICEELNQMNIIDPVGEENDD